MEHRWVVFPRMRTDEVLLLKVFDSRRDGRTRFHLHSAIKDPRGEAGAQRQSVEFRCVVLLDKEAGSEEEGDHIRDRRPAARL